MVCAAPLESKLQSFYKTFIKRKDTDLYSRILFNTLDSTAKNFLRETFL